MVHNHQPNILQQLNMDRWSALLLAALLIFVVLFVLILVTSNDPTEGRYLHNTTHSVQAENSNINYQSRTANYLAPNNGQNINHLAANGQGQQNRSTNPQASTGSRSTNAAVILPSSRRSDPSGYRINFVSNCPQTLFLGALGPSQVMPREGTWELPPQGRLTIDIPPDWLSTAGKPVIGPRFWARTGCQVDAALDKAQCETGDCGGKLDCSQARLAGQTPVSLVEFCFYCGDGLTYWDVSLVDGYNISIDVTPEQPFNATRPGDPDNPFWCKTNLCKSGADLREICPADFTLMNTQLPGYLGGPAIKAACFTNCGKYAYPLAPAQDCDPATDSRCAAWRKYCCNSNNYGRACNSDNDCTDGAACWQGKCQCRSFNVTDNCPNDICTNPNAMPSPGRCSAANGTGQMNSSCIGDDTVHQICPRAYSWPNDPQTYSCDAKTYTITFCPGGTRVPLSPVSNFPLCSSLPTEFNWSQAQVDCALGKGTYSCARRRPTPWACNVDNVPCLDGVTCKWG